MFGLCPVVFVKSRDRNLVGTHDVFFCFSFGYAELIVGRLLCLWFVKVASNARTCGWGMVCKEQ